MRKIRLIIIGFIALFGLMAQSQTPSYIENFEEGRIPDTWVIHDENDDFRMWESDSREAESGDWSISVSANSDGKKDDWLVTPKLLPTEEQHTFSFYAKSQVPIPFLLESFEVKLSTTDVATEDFEVMLGQETDVPAEWTQYTYDLSDYIGEEIFVALRNNSIDKTVLFADTFHAPFFFYEDDLKVNALTGSTTPMIGQSHTYEVVVENSGWNTQSDYDVVLYDENDVELVRMGGMTLDAFQEIIVPVSWTPESEDITHIYAVVELAGDENPGNNTGDPWYISVHHAMFEEVVNGTYENYEFSPIFYPAKTSLSESVYHAEDLNMMGYLTEIVYTANIAYEVRDKNIRVWVGETAKRELDMEWIPSTDLTLVYDGQITVPKGEWEIPVRFNEAYQYKGGNLVVMVEREWDDRAYGYENTFSATATSGMQTIQYGNNFEATSSENPSVDPFWTKSSPYTPDIKLYFDVENMGSLSGTVADINEAPVEGVRIQAEELNYLTYSQTDGAWDIPFIFAGDYHFIAEKHGYYPCEAEVSVAENQNQTLDFEMEPVPEVLIEGRVTGSDAPETGIEGATVKLNGYDNYTTTTDASGYFSFESVYTGNVYMMSVEADGYTPFQMDVTVNDSPLDLGTITLNEVTPPPIQVTATDFDMMAGVSWMAPDGMPANDFRYDDGTVVSQAGLSGSFPHVAMGAVHHNNAVLKSVSWYLTDEAPHDSVKIIILGLDMMGKPDGANILFESDMIPNTDNEWNVYELPMYVDAPDGFFVGINTPNQFTAIGVDDGMEAPYEFSFGTHYVTDDWTSGNEWMDLGDFGFMENMMIRANGFMMGFKKQEGDISQHEGNENHSKLPLIKKELKPVETTHPEMKAGKGVRQLEGYSVYRLVEGNEGNQDEWSSLTSGFTGTFYEDFEWSALQPGSYRYAVIAEYSNGLEANPRFSNVLVKEEKVDVQLEVTTNSDDPVTGAQLAFESVQGFGGFMHNGILDESGTVSLTNVPKDAYNIRIELEGFDVYVEQNISIDSDTTLSFELTELWPAPFNPEVEVVADEGNAVFSWNNKPDAVTEDFEGLENFSEDLGTWTSVDVDGMNTMQMTAFDYPLNGNPMGFVVFNPQATEPAMMDVSAYSGERCAAAVNAEMSESDDWLISPKIEEVVNGSVFSFMARSSSDMWELEWFRVGVSTTGNNPEDFTIISEGDFLVAPFWNWQEFTFDLSAFAGEEIYVAIQHITVDGYMLLIDDLFVGMPEKQSRAFIDYTIFLDDQERESTTSESFIFTELNDGQQYTAAVKANYTTGSSEKVFFDFTASNLTGVDEMSEVTFRAYTNPANGSFYIETDDKGPMHITIFNAMGQRVLMKTEYDRKTRIDLDAKGVFWVQVRAQERTSVKKIVVE